MKKNNATMNMSKELLARYASGNVDAEERTLVRKYLSEHPEEMETVLMLMDEDYDLNPEESDSMSHLTAPIAGATIGLSATAAAFAMPLGHLVGSAVVNGPRRSNVIANLDELLESL